MKKCTLLWVVLSLCAVYVPTAYGFETKANHAILTDADTSVVLFEKDADTTMPPSSMSKLMTVYMIFEQLKKGTLSMDDKFTVSQKAWRKQGSKMFVHVGDQVTVKDLLQGVIVQSGNDACIVLAEGLMGSEEAFAEAMTKRAKEMGLQNSSFKNSTGWPDDEHFMTSRDLSILARHLIQDFPEYYYLFSEKEFTYNNIRQENRNMLIDRDISSDGLKTGHTEAAGYGITASAKKNGRRLIVVVNGLKSTVERANEAERLLQYGFLNFDNLTLFKKDSVIDQMPVWAGKNATVSLISNEDIIYTLPKAAMDKVKATVVYNTPLPAPVKKGDHVADLIVTIPDMPNKTYPLVAAEDVEKASYFGRLYLNIKYYLFK